MQREFRQPRFERQQPTIQPQNQSQQPALKPPVNVAPQVNPPTTTPYITPRAPREPRKPQEP